MALSIAYGIAFATFLTLIMLPIFLSFSNKVKVSTKWLKTGNIITKEEVERAIKEQVEEMHLETQTSVIDLEEDKPRTKTIPTRELESKES